MEWVTAIILISLIYYGSCEDCVLPRPKEQRPEVQLLIDLRKDYESLEPPQCNSTQGVEVKVEYLVEEFYFSDDEETLTLYSKNTFEWEDNRLKWDVDKYKGVKSIQMYNLEIWTPLLKLKNRVSIGRDGLFDVYKCEVKYTGLVYCLSSVEHSVMCRSTIKDWPYDKKNCTFKFDDETMLLDETNIIFTEVALGFFMETKMNNGWQFLKGYTKNNLTGDHQVSIELFLERKAECLEASILVPSFIVFVLTVTSIVLNVNNNVRLGILYFNLLNHFAISKEISMNVPNYGSDIPVILLFVSRSTIWTILILLLTFLLRYMSKLTSPPPSFLVFINSLVFNSVGKHFVIPRWNVEILDKSIMDSLSHCTEWIDFSNIVNSISLYVTLITYIILFSIYMPHNIYNLSET